MPRLHADWSRKDGEDKFWRPDMGKEIYLIGTKKDVFTKKPELPTEVVAAPSVKQHARDGARQESDRTAEVSVTALPPGPDLPGERTSTRVVRASPPEMPRGSK